MTDSNPYAGRPFHFSAVLVGIVAVVLLCLATPYQDLISKNMIAGGHSAPILATLFFLILALFNSLAGVILRGLGLRGKEMGGGLLGGRELAVVFCMLLVASGIPSMGMADYLLPTLVAPFYYADASNGWAALFHSHLPAWLVPSKDPASPVIQNFVDGSAAVPWRAWLPCLFWWSTALAALYLATFSLCSLLSESWIRAERLNFPLMELPVELFEPRQGRASWRCSAFWTGVLVPVFLYSWNGASDYFPQWPQIPMGVNLASIVGGSFGVFNAQLFPSLMGFFYFVPTSVTCGIWSFFLFMKAQRYLGTQMGTNLFSYGGQSYGGASELHQGMGAMMVLLAGWLWVARESLARQANAALNRRSLALWGFLGGLAYLVLFWAVAGLKLWIGLCFFLSYFVIAVALTRLVAQAGLPYVQSAFVPSDMITSFAGPRALMPRDMSLLGLQFPMSFDIAGFLMPSVFNSLKVADRLGLPPRRLLLALGLAVLVALPVSFYSFLTVTYHYGGSAKTDWWFFEGSPKLPFSTFASMARHPEEIERNASRGVLFVGFGGAVTAGLLYLLRHFPGWPIHPLGYILSGTWVIQRSWFSCFAAWFLKMVIVQYGSGKTYHAFAPFFLGLILGGFVTPGFWAVIDFFTGKVNHPIPVFPP